MLEALSRYWARHPDLRLAQLVCNHCPTGMDPYYVGDDELLRRLGASLVKDDEDVGKVVRPPIAGK